MQVTESTLGELFFCSGGGNGKEEKNKKSTCILV